MVLNFGCLAGDASIDAFTLECIHQDQTRTIVQPSQSRDAKNWLAEVSSCQRNDFTLRGRRLLCVRAPVGVLRQIFYEVGNGLEDILKPNIIQPAPLGISLRQP